MILDADGKPLRPDRGLHVPNRLRSVGWFGPVRIRDENGEVVWEEWVWNGATTVGLNHMLGATFKSETQNGTWYGGLINNSGFSAIAAADTMSSHAGWTEATTYSASTRPAWTPGTASGGSLAGTGAITWTANTSCTIRGLLIVSTNNKGGSTGILWATGLFSSAQSLLNGQTLESSYTTTLTG